MVAMLIRNLRFVAAMALLGVALIPAIASAAPFSPPDFESVAGDGHNPVHPLAIVGTVRNTLLPGQSVWYQTAYAGAPPLGVAVNYDPANTPPPGTIQMHVDWTTPNGTPDVDWPGYYRVAEGTTSGLAQGVLYWQTSVSPTAPYLVEIVNNSTVAIGYAIAVTGQQFPPPSLNPAPPGVIEYFT
jgi:hypothetical protein